MKFTPKEDFKSKATTFEAGNRYDSDKQGMTEEQLKRWHANGWTEVEGWDPAPPRQVRGVVVQPHSARHAQKETPHG